jgi:rRNA maturation protein Rpf1
MSINKTRGFLYMLSRFLGDVNAVKRGKVGKRIARRAAGKATGKVFWRLFK